MMPGEVLNYIENNAKYLVAMENQDFDVSTLTKFLIPHKYKPRMLYCMLTKNVVNRTRNDCEKHVEGRRFQTKVYQQWKK